MSHSPDGIQVLGYQVTEQLPKRKAARCQIPLCKKSKIAILIDRSAFIPATGLSWTRSRVILALCSHVMLMIHIHVA